MWRIGPGPVDMMTNSTPDEPVQPSAGARVFHRENLSLDGRRALEQLLQANWRLHTAYPGLKVLTYTLPEILNHPDNTHSLCRRTSFLLTLKRGDRVSPCWWHHGDGHLSSYNQLRRTEEG